MDLSISDTHVFWCGSDGLDVGRAVGLKVTNSTFSGTPGAGIRNSFGTRSLFFANTCQAQSLNGNGSPSEQYCVYEDTTANNNTYLNNDGSGTTYGNSMHGGLPMRPLPVSPIRFGSSAR
jgi:hypothetical protein